MVISLMKSHFKEYKELKKKYNESENKKEFNNKNKRNFKKKRKIYEERKSKFDYLFEDITPRNK